jgi:ABC-type phosphate transport system substrate-binding protein
MDDGSTDFYGDGQEAKELIPEFEKSRSDHFTLQLATPPVNEAPPSASGATAPGSELTCAPGDWAGDPVPTFTYRWQRDGTPIAGAESDNYSTTVADGGHEIGCAVTATNTFGNETANSNAIAIEPAPAGCLGASITGAGSTAQDVAQALWAPAFVAGCPGGPDVSYDANGSGTALSAWSADGKAGALDTGLALVGTDTAPTAAQLANIESVAGGAHVLVVPVAQTAIAVAVHPPAECQIERIANKQLESVFRGNVLRWGQLDTATGPGCPGKPITRVVEAGSAGLTAQFESYFGQVNPATLPCTEGGKTWVQLASTGGAWPRAGLGGCAPSTISALAVPAQEGGEAVIEALNAAPGSIGFAALPELEAVRGPETTALRLQNNGIVKLANATFAEPQLDEAANCDSTRYRVPTSQDWSAVFGSNMKIGGDAYPLCSLTYDLALQGYDKAGFAPGTATTVKGYLEEEVLAPSGQTALGSAHYSPLPSDGDPHYEVLGAAQAAAGGIGD